MAYVNLAHGKCSRLVITDGDEEEEEEMFPASRTNCPVCPGLMGFPGGRTFSTKARKSQANRNGWSFSPCIVSRLTAEPGGGTDPAGGLKSLYL